MSPRAERTPPPFVQIADHYRQLIQDGKLKEGDKLPTVKELSKEWGVATATAAKGLGQLTVEGYVRTSPRGSFVENAVTSGASTSRDRLMRTRRTGSPYADGEWIRVTSTEILRAPNYVADLFGLELEEDGREPRVVRREWVTIRGKQPVALSVSWHPAQFAELVPALLETERQHRDLVVQIEAALGKTLTRGRDDIEARRADKREAGLLGIPLGEPILAMVHRWSDDENLVEYAEHCLPPKHPIGYDYEL